MIVALLALSVLTTQLAKLHYPDVRDFGASCTGVADDSPALARAADALAGSGATLDVPGDCRLRLAGARQVWLRGIHVRGPGVRELGAQRHVYGTQGGTILLGDRGKAPFVVSSDWSIDGLNFVWPDQTEQTIAKNQGRPIVYPPLIVPHQTGGLGDLVYSWRFSNNQVENAYDVADLRTAADVGHWHWDNNQEFALRYHIRLQRSGGESWVTNNQFSLIAQFYGIAGTNTAGPGGTQTSVMEHFAAAHAELLHIDGAGTARGYEKRSVDGMSMRGNYALAMRFGVHVVGGTMNIGSMIGDSFDQVQTVLQADDGGAFYAVHVVGGEWLCQAFGGGAVAPCVSVDGAPGSTLAMEGVQVPVTLGPAIIFKDRGVGASLSIVGGSLLNVGNIASGNPHAAITFDAPNGLLIVADLPITTTTTAQRNAAAVVIDAAKAAVLSGIIFDGWSVPVMVQARSGAFSLTGCTSFGSPIGQKLPAISGVGADLVAQSGNRWETAK